MHYAVESMNFELVSTLVMHGADVNIMAKYDFFETYYWRGRPTPLHLAAKLNWVDVLAYLIQHGAGCCNENVSDAFDIAIGKGNLKTVGYFLDNHVDQLDFRDTMQQATELRDAVLFEVVYKAAASLNEKNSLDNTPLGLAAIFGEVDVVEKLVELGADIDKIANGLTPLGHAAVHGHGDIARILLSAGAQPDLTGHQMPTPWQLAISNGFDEIADEIASSTKTGSSKMTSDTFAQATAEDRIDIVKAPFRYEDENWKLGKAVADGDLELTERLIKQGCNSDGRKESRFFSLSLAIIREQWAIATLLVEAMAELSSSHEDCKSILGRCLMEALTRSNIGIIDLMIRRGADVNICNETGATPLLKALNLYEPQYKNGRKSSHSNGAVVRTLLKAGADVNVVDEFGRTPLGKATAIGNLDAVRLLVEARAELNRPSSQNPNTPTRCVKEWVYRTPLAWAALHGYYDVVKYLFDSGAEWRSLPKEPALTYTHRLLMKS